MLPATIDYILSLRDATGGQVASHAQYQVIMANVPPVTTINYSISPTAPIRALILYELVFGGAMVPHAFNVRMMRGSDRILDVIVSGRFTTIPTNIFVIVGEQQPAVNISATNLRLLANYYEMTTSYLVIANQDNYDIVIDALRRMHTSTKTEQLLTAIRDKPSGGGSAVPYPPIAGGRK